MKWSKPVPPAAGQAVTGSVVFGHVLQIMDVGGNVTIVSPNPPPYWVTEADGKPVPVSVARAQAQPSRLLLARHQIVPFIGRERTLSTLARWAGTVEPVAARLVYATGGQGKTRLAGQVGTVAAAAGWAVWQVTRTPTSGAGFGPALVQEADAGEASRVAAPAGAVLVVVDYADRWPASALLTLLTQMHDVHQTLRVRVRVLLLARSDGYWWPAVANRADSDLGIDVDQMTLPTLSADSHNDRPGMFTTAAGRFAAAMDLPVPAGGWPVPPLSGSEYGQVLAVHMAALAAVDAHRRGLQAPADPAAVSTHLLRREMEYWLQLHTRTEAPVRTRPELMHRVVFTATLTGALPRSVAGQALTRTGFTDTENPTDRVIDEHAVCYPPADARTVFEPLHPDRLGEDLIALSIPGDRAGEGRLAHSWAPEAITRLLIEPPVWTAAAVTVLIEAAHRWPHLTEQVLYPLIRVHPQTVIAAGGATITRLTGLPGLDPTVLEPLEPLLPADRHIDFDIASAAISSRLVKDRVARTDDPAEHAGLYATHARRLSHAGLHEEALAHSQQAADLYLQLAQTNPAGYLPNLAAMMTNIGLLMDEVGRREEALGPAQEAVTLRRWLAEANPDAYLFDLAGSLVNLGSCLSHLGRWNEALGPTEEATGVYRRLAQINAAEHLPGLAAALTGLGWLLLEVGRWEEALGAAGEAVTIRRRLVEANAAAYLPDLAASLNNLGMCLGQLGRREEALGPAGEAVTFRRRLVEANPAAYLPDLAMSLNNLGLFLDEVGRSDEALGPAEEAVTFRRRLVEANPAAYLPDLAMSLNNLGMCLGHLGRWKEALGPAEEATDFYRQLAQVNPAGYLPDLAMSLNNLGMCQAHLGRHAQALGQAGEAVAIRRRLAGANPATYLPKLAMSLWGYAMVCVTIQDNLRDALDAINEAIGLFAKLADQLADVFAGQLLGACKTLADVLDGLGRTDEATYLRRQLDQSTGGGPDEG